MKFNGKQVKQFLSRIDRSRNVMIFYGSDLSKIKTLSDELIAGIVGDIHDPFRIFTIQYSVVNSDVVQFIDLASNICIGGTSVIRVVDVSESISEGLKKALGNYKGCNHIVFVAGNLTPKSSIRKFFETSKEMLALPCYADSNHEIRNYVSKFFADRGISYDNGVIDLLISFQDRLLLNHELEKILLYTGEGKSVNTEDVIRCIGHVGDNAEINTLCMAFASRDKRAVISNCTLLLSGHKNDIAIIRSLINYLFNLLKVMELMKGGLAIDQAMKHLYPPIFFKYVDNFKRHVGAWNTEGLSSAISRLLEMEKFCKSSTPISNDLFLKQMLLIMTYRF